MVRITVRKTVDFSSAPITHLSLLADFPRRLDPGEFIHIVALIELAQFIGSIGSVTTDEESARTQRQAEQLRAAVIATMEKLGSRAGGGVDTSSL